MAERFWKMFQESYRNKTNLDFTLIAESREVKAHKSVLQLSSDYFKEELEDNRIGEAVVSDVTEVNLRQCVDFMYFETLNEEIDVKELFRSAHMLKMAELKRKCMKMLENNINANNCVDIYQLIRKCSDIWNMDEKGYGGSLIIESASKLLADKNVLRNMESHTLQMVLNTDELPVKDELFLFKAVFDWVSANERGRTNHICIMISLVRLPLIDKTDFITVVNKNDHLKECPKCKKYLEKSQDYLIQQKTATGLKEYQTEARRHPVVVINITCTTFMTFKNEKAVQSDRPFPISQYLVDCFTLTFHDGCFYLLECEGTRFSCFDKTHDKWNEQLPIPRKHYRHKTISYRDQILVIGGRNDKGLNIVDSFNVTTNTWNELPSMNEGRQMPATVVYNGSVYVMGGFDGIKQLSSVERFCSEANNWLKMPSMNQTRDGHSAHVLNGKIFVAGGWDNSAKELSSVETYREEDKVWTNIANMNCARNFSTLFTYGGSLYVFGGSGNDKTSLWEKYNQKENKWEASEKQDDHFEVCKSFSVY